MIHTVWVFVEKATFLVCLMGLMFEDYEVPGDKPRTPKGIMKSVRPTEVRYRMLRYYKRGYGQWTE